MLLLSLAAASIIGTVIPQNAGADAYVQSYGQFLYRFFSVLDLFDMYHSWWFQLLLLLMTVNIVVCSIDRLKTTGKVIFVKEPTFRLSRFRQQKDRTVFTDPRPPEALRPVYTDYLAGRFGYHRVEDTPEGFAVFAEKWRWTRLGVYTVHLSVVLLLAGGIIGSIFGFEGFVNIPEGETVSEIRLRNSQEKHILPFAIRCNDFNVSFYENGAPREYRSSLSIIEDGKETVRKDIIVNDPLRYGGINIFQSSYGSMPPNRVTLSITAGDSGMVYTKTMEMGERIDLPEKLGILELHNFTPSGQFRGHNIGETFVARYTSPEGEKQVILLPLRFPSFDRMRKGAFTVAVKDYDKRYYTGLQVTRDPGVWVVYAGFIIMILGCIITFFMSHQRVCIDVVAQGTGSRVTVAGTANKNKLGMQNKVMRIARALGAPES